MAYQPEQRALVEQLLNLYGYRPEALPNLFQLRAPHPQTRGILVPRTPGEVTPAIQHTVAQLADWRTMFPETVDSIIGLIEERRLPHAGYTTEEARWASRPGLWDVVPPERALDIEPAPPQFAGPARFEGRLPDPRLRMSSQHPGRFTMAEWENLHPRTIRRLDATELRPRAFTGGPPDFGGAITSRALLRRLKREAPELANQLVGAIPLTQLHQFQVDPLVAENELTRRIANIYSQLPYRHSSQPINPRLLTEDANRFLQQRTSREMPLPGQHLHERMREAEFRPGKASFDNLMDELAVMQGETEEAIGRTRIERDLSQSAKTAMNPTNAKIQKLLSENLGFGKGKVMAPFVEDTLDPMRHLRPARLARAVPWMLADIGVNKAIDELVPEKGPWDDLLRGAYMGGTTGAMFGVPGAVAGAGIGALLSQVF